MRNWVAMLWNVENLIFPDLDLSGKLAALAAVIEQQQPDVLPLQEIGPGGALQHGLRQGIGHCTDACG